MEIKAFKGLNNVSDPMRLDMSWLVQADNMNVSDTGALSKREGYSLTRGGDFAGMFSTFDFQRCYTATPTAIMTFDTTKIIAYLNSTAPLYWCEINGQVFYNNGTDRGIILGDDTLLPWDWYAPPAPTVSAASGTLPAGTYQVACTYLLHDGRETGAGEVASIELTEGQSLQIANLPGAIVSLKVNVYIAPANSDVFQLYATTAAASLTFNASPDTLGRDLLNQFLDPLPVGATVVQAWRGRIYAAQPMISDGQSVIWFSEALGFHLWNLNSNFFMVPGEVLMLAPHNDALIIGTENRIYAYDGAKLEQLAAYGVVRGKGWDADDQHNPVDGRLNPENNRILFWSQRGLCAALPFTNLTQGHVSVAPGSWVAGCVIRSGGQKRFLTCLRQGGEVFNAYP